MSEAWALSTEHLDGLVRAHQKFRSHLLLHGHIQPGEGLPVTPAPKEKKEEPKKPTHEGWCMNCGKKVNAETKGERHHKNDMISLYGPCENCGTVVHRMDRRAPVKSKEKAKSGSSQKG